VRGTGSPTTFTILHKYPGTGSRYGVEFLLEIQSGLVERREIRYGKNEVCELQYAVRRVLEPV
jgi:hypothetical protein